MLGLRFCARAFSSCGKWGPLFIAVRGPLTIAASLVVEHRLQTRRLSSCGSRAQLLHGMWDPPRPGLEPVSPALAGRLSTTAPPGKPPIMWVFKWRGDSSLAGDISKVHSKFTVVNAPEDQCWGGFLRIPRKVPRSSHTEWDFERCRRKEVRTTQSKDKSNLVMETPKDDKHNHIFQGAKSREQREAPFS